jgi:serine/threonine protein kinase
MAVAYLAENVDFKRLVAIKVLRPDKGFEDGAVERFRTEAVAVAQLRHPHIIGVHARGEEGDILWFEMDFIDGGSLENKIAAGPIPPKTVARYVAQAADALAYAHARGIIHRDIKPSNLLIASGTDHLVITDFGIAKILGKTSVTETGVTVGTMAYMSPEQLAADRNLTSAADQYSLGVVAYQSVLGILPYEGTSPGQFIAAQVQRSAPPILIECPDCPPDLAKLIERMLAPTPEARWQDIFIVRRAGEEIALTGAAPSLRDAAPPIYRKRTLARRRPKAAIATSSVVLALAVLGYFAWQRRLPQTPSQSASVIKPPVAPQSHDTGHADSANKAAGVVPNQVHLGSARGDKKSSLDAVPRLSSRDGETGRKSVPPATALADTVHQVAPPLAPPPPPQAPTTAVLSITSKLPGTFVYIAGDPTVHPIPVGPFIDITVPSGNVHLRITSNQPGCVDLEDDITLAPGAHKRIQRSATCPNP